MTKLKSEMLLTSKNATVKETDDKIRDELGDFYIRVSAIGEAGEKLCRFAAIINDEFRAIGRSGMGGVMGSKNLKAVAVRGTHDVNVANLEGFKEFIKMIHERMKGPSTKKYKTLGTPENVLGSQLTLSFSNEKLDKRNF